MKGDRTLAGASLAHARTQIDRLTQSVVQAYREGTINEALKDRHELSQYLESTSGDYREKTVEARARCAQMHLFMIDRQSAAHCLRPFVRGVDADKIKPNRSQLKKLERTTSLYTRGLIIAQISHLLYASFQFELGAALAREADRLLTRQDGEVNGLDRILAECENRIWWARLTWRCRQHDDAEARLRETIETLDRYAASQETTGGLDRVTALALDVWASFDSKRGLLESARSKAYRGLFLLRGDSVADTVLLAHLLYLTGHIESASSWSAAALPLPFLLEAKKLFERWEHPFTYRTKIQMAQYLIRTGQTETAECVLDEVDAAEIHDSGEPKFVRADALLTRVWILERAAREDPCRWSDCVELAERLLSMKRLPARLEAEAHLHCGLALVHSSRVGERRRGRVLLRKALELARAGGRRKIEIAVHFAKVEDCLRRDASSRRVLEHLQEGTRLMTDVDSAFLREWRERLAQQIERSVPLEIDPGQTLEDAKQELERHYLAHLDRRTDTRAKLFEWAGLTPATGFRLLAKHGIGRTSKQKSKP